MIEQGSGKITWLSDNGFEGRLADDGTGEEHEFLHRGANVQFNIHDAVTYLFITMPNGGGKKIIEIKKPNT